MSTKHFYLTFVLGIALVGSGCSAPIVYKKVKKSKVRKEEHELEMEEMRGQLEVKRQKSDELQQQQQEGQQQQSQQEQ